MEGFKRRTIKGQGYVLVLLKTLEKDAFGRPTKVEVGYDDTTFNLQGREEFYTGFISETAVLDATNPRAKG